MSYAKDTKKDPGYTGVNHLIQPKRYNGLSILPPYAAALQTKSAQENQEPAADVVPPEIVASFEVEPQNTPMSENVVTPEETTAPEAVPEPAGFALSIDQQTEPPAEAAVLKAESFVVNESEIDEGSKADQNETESRKQSEVLQKKSIAAAAAGTEAPAAPNPGAKFTNLASQNQGEPLPEKIQHKMGRALGMDFKNVQLHSDAPTAAMASNLGAKAFTKGENIYFNQGEYNPETTAGQHLIAHELTHVKQQRTIPGLQYKLQEASERDRYEQEADAVADRVTGSSTGAFQMKTSTAAASSGLSQNAARVQCKDDGGPSWILKKIGEWLSNIPGYDILTLIIGRDPVTGQEVKRDGYAFVKAIVGLIPGGKLLLENLEKANIISRVTIWFKEEFKKLNLSFATIKRLFSQAWDALSVWDLRSPKIVFEKIKNIFAAPVRRIMNFIVTAGSKMAEFVFEGALTLVGAPVKQIMGVLNKGKSVLQQIINDPIGFFKNLANAVKGGLNNFVGNIKTHLQNGIGGWLFGALGKAGLVMPDKFNLAGIFSIVAQVLGVTWKAIRAIVVKRLGPTGEKVMGQVEKSVAFIGNLITKGPLALIEMAQEFISELPGLFFGSLMEWVRNTIIVKAIQKLISMFNPVGAIIQAVIAIYNTVQFFIERAQQIAEFVSAVFNSIAEIAGGNIGKAIAAVENALAKGLPVAISFLANLLGLGGIAAKIKEIIQKIRKPIEKVVGKVVGFVVGKAKALLAQVAKVGKGVVGGIKDWWKTRKGFQTEDGEKHTIFFEGSKNDAELMVASTPTPVFEFLKSVKNDKNKEEVNRAGQIASKIIAISRKLAKLPDDPKEGPKKDEKEGLIDQQAIAISDLADILSNLGGAKGNVSGWVLHANRLRNIKEQIITFIEERKGDDIIGYKVDVVSEKGFMVGRSAAEENKYVANLSKTKRFNEEYTLLSGKDISERREHIQGSGKGQSNTEKIQTYDRVLKKAGITAALSPITDPSNPTNEETEDYRHAMFNAVLSCAKYKDNIELLDNEILHGDLGLNPGLTGQMFEKWVVMNFGSVSAVEVVFKNAKKEIIRKSDGRVKGKTILVEIKSDKSGPSKDEIDQMEDYQGFIEKGTVGFIGSGKGQETVVFTNIQYHFVLPEYADLWIPVLKKVFEGITVTIYTGTTLYQTLK